METLAALAGNGRQFASFSAIGGLGGADISYGDMLHVISTLDRIKDEPGEHETVWLMQD